MASNSDTAFVDGCVYPRMVCGGPESKLDKSASRRWFDDICSDLGTSDWGVVDTQSSKEKERQEI